MQKYPLLRTYSIFKNTFKQEKYLSLKCESKYITAISRLRASSHTLAIEKGRHEIPKKPIDQRLCNTCKVVEDEKHFVTECVINTDERNILYDKVSRFDQNFSSLTNHQKFAYLFQHENETALTWFGKFIFKSFNKRNIDCN